MGGEELGVALSRQDGADDGKPGRAGDVGHHHVEHNVHLGQGLLHPQDAG
jgi:hypothetical protein